MPMVIRFCFIHKDLHIFKNVSEQESMNLVKWFENNFMKANPEKFQAICLCKRAYEGIDSFDLEGTQIKCEENVTLLGTCLKWISMFLRFVKRHQNSWGRSGAVVRASDFGPKVPGSHPGRCAFRCGLEQVTFTPCLNPGRDGRTTELDRL